MITRESIARTLAKRPWVWKSRAVRTSNEQTPEPEPAIRPLAHSAESLRTGSARSSAERGPDRDRDRDRYGSLEAGTTAEVQKALISAELRSSYEEEWHWFANKLPEPQTIDIMRTKRLKHLASMGMPSELRGKLWCAFGGVHRKIEASNRYYAKLHREKSFLETVVPQSVREQIDLDVPRTFSTHQRFQTPEGLRTLRRVLLAFSYYNPVVGYCQGLGYLSGALLIHMDEECAFWALVTLVQEMIPADYFTSSMTGFHSDQTVFQEMIDEKLPELAQHFVKIGMSTTDFSSQWFLCLFLRVLPFECAMRVWDVFWYSGPAAQAKVLFSVGLALLYLYQNSLLEAETVPEAAQVLNQLSKTGVDTDALIHLAVTSCKVSSSLLERQRLRYRTGIKPGGRPTLGGPRGGGAASSSPRYR